MVPSIDQVDAIVELYRKADDRKGRPKLLEKPQYDYIRNPKRDGYRSHHLVMEYQSDSPKYSEFGGLKVEIQVRTRLQHAWATAVETAGLFRSEDYKSPVKKGRPEWEEFFALTSALFAAKENRPIGPAAPNGRDSVVARLLELNAEHQFMDQFAEWKVTLEHFENRLVPKGTQFLLYLNVREGRAVLREYPRNQSSEAFAAYANLEKSVRQTPEISVVLVSTEDVSGLKRAYPNYLADTSIFVEAVRSELYG